jgi:hypothetical protein
MNALRASLFLFPFGILLLTLVGCDQPYEETRQKQEALEKNLYEMRSALATLKEVQSDHVAQSKRIEELAASIKKIEQQLGIFAETDDKLSQKAYELELKVDQFQTIALDESGKGYQRLETENGFFLVKLRQSTPFQDGFKLALEILNPNAVVFTGAIINLKWGPELDERKETYQAWSKKLRQTEVKINNPVGAGSRTNIEVFLPRTTRQELENLIVTMKTEGVKTQAPKASDNGAARKRTTPPSK